MTAAEVFANQPTTTVSTGGTTAPASGTVESWTVSSSASFPAASTGVTQFHVADTAAGKTGEIITVTNVSGTTWTVTRGAESSTTVAHTAGFTIVQVVTAGWLGTVSTSAGVQAIAFTYGSSGAVPSSGTFTAGQVAVDQNDILRVCTVSGSPGTWARAGAQPYQFWVDDYGAKGDGKVFINGTGTASSAAFSDTTTTPSPFASGDVGKYIIVNQGTGGSSTSPKVTTISGFTDTSHVTLASALGSNAATAPYVFGTDDAAAFRNCFAAAVTYAQANNYEAQVICGAKNYMLASLEQQTSPFSANSHIVIDPNSQTAQKLQIELVGAGSESSSSYWNSTVPNLRGTTLVSASFTNTEPNGTYGQQSVIGGPNAGLGGTDVGNTLFKMSGVTIVCPWNSQQIGVHAYNLSQLDVSNCKVMAFAAVNLGAATLGGPYLSTNQIPTNDKSIGFAFPTWLNNDLSRADNAQVEGLSIGFDIAEHFTSTGLLTIYCDRGIQVSNLSSGAHGAIIGYWSCEQCNYGIYCFNSGAGALFPIQIAQWDFEDIWTQQISDPNSLLTGRINWSAFTSGHPDTGGVATNLELINQTKNLPGIWSGAPAAPANNTAQQNTAYRYATVYASATTGITNTHAGLASGALTALGQTAGNNVVVPIRVAPGGWYSVTYTGALTTTWWLD